MILWEFKKDKNATEAAEKICSVYGEGVNTDFQVRNWFSMFSSCDALSRDEPIQRHSLDFVQYILRELEECNPHISTWKFVLDFNTFKSTICRHLKKKKS